MDLTESELPKLCVKLIKQNTIYFNISGYLPPMLDFNKGNQVSKVF